MPASKIRFISDGSIAEYQRPEMERKTVKGYWYKYTHSDNKQSVKLGTETYFRVEDLDKMKERNIIEILEP